jgi:hypothetical protein
VISFARSERLRLYQSSHGQPFPLYADPERAVYRAFELRRLSLWKLLSPRVFSRYWRLLREGRRLQRTRGDDIYQGGGDFVVAPDGRVLYAHRSEDPADRPSVEALKSAVLRM